MHHPHSLLVLVLLALVLGMGACGRSTTADEEAPARRVLRVCADPNNLPFSNEREEGFENRIARLVASELDAELAYVWAPQRRGFLRKGVNAGTCDVVLGLASQVDFALTTRPYYRSTYVFVSPPDRVPVLSLDDPVLATRRIGVQIIGDDYANSPPVHALTRRGLADRLVGYTVYGDYAADSPIGDVVRAVGRGEIDLAVAWGPIGGYYASRAGLPLVLSPVSPSTELGSPMQFDVSFAVQRGRTTLRDELDELLVRRRPAIDAILEEFGVPRV